MQQHSNGVITFQHLEFSELERLASSDERELSLYKEMATAYILFNLLIIL